MCKKRNRVRNCLIPLLPERQEHLLRKRGDLVSPFRSVVKILNVLWNYKIVKRELRNSNLALKEPFFQSMAPLATLQFLIPPSVEFQLPPAWLGHESLFLVWTRRCSQVPRRQLLGSWDECPPGGGGAPTAGMGGGQWTSQDSGWPGTKPVKCPLWQDGTRLLYKALPTPPRPSFWLLAMSVRISSLSST